MKAKLIKIGKIALGLSILALLIWGFCHNVGLTLLLWLAFAEAKKHWKIVSMILLTSVISCAGGVAILYLIHFIFTGDFIIYKNSLWMVGYLFTSIYALGLLIEEDQRKPYLWIWRQMKKLVTFLKPQLD